MKRIRTCAVQRALGAGMLAVALQAAAEADAQPPSAGPLDFEDAPPLVQGRLPAPALILAWQRLPADEVRRRAVLDALGEAVGRLPDGSVNLGWLGDSACSAGAPCEPPSAPRRLDGARRKDFADLLHRAAQRSPGAAGGEMAPLVAAASSMLAHNTGDGRDGARLACRQAHLIVLGTGIPAGTMRPAQAGNGAPAEPVVHRVALAASPAAQAIDDTLRTVLADSRGIAGWRDTALVQAPSDSQDASLLVAARYDALRWQGELAARTLRGGAVDTGSAPWGRQPGSGRPHTTASLLDGRAPGSRMILSSRGEAGRPEGIAWQWPRLATPQRDALGRDAAGRADDGLGERRLAWLRGARDDEQTRGGPLRDRAAVQGDAIRAVPWVDAGVDGGPALIFTGGNDGMLHAFDAADGQERFAYVPQGLHASLAASSHPAQMHQALVDGSPFTATWQDGRLTRRWVFGFPGAGGKGYFALDVGDAGAFGEESRAAAQVRLDTTASDHPDLGRILGAPVTAPGNPPRAASVARLRDGRPALVLGNGWGSTSQRAALLIQYLDGPRELRTIAAGTAGGNGLAPARLVDLDGDGTAELAYAGDLLGRLWKFDLRAEDPAQWGVALAGQPLFQARDARGRPQPITVAPHWLPHPDGGRMLVLGTGRLFGGADRQDDGVQTLYGIHDRDDGRPIGAGRAALVRRSLHEAPAGADPSGTGGAGDGPAPAANSAAPAADRPAPADGPDLGPPGADMRGWFIDLPLAGERVLAHPVPFDAQLVDTVSTLPAPTPGNAAAESCTPAHDRRWRNTVRALDGRAPRTLLYGDGSAALGANRLALPAAPGVALRLARQERRLQFDGSHQAPRNRPGFTAVRPAWRRLR